jgi:hypothetical protein
MRRIDMASHSVAAIRTIQVIVVLIVKILIVIVAIVAFFSACIEVAEFPFAVGYELVLGKRLQRVIVVVIVVEHVIAPSE